MKIQTSWSLPYYVFKFMNATYVEMFVIYLFSGVLLGQCIKSLGQNCEMNKNSVRKMQFTPKGQLYEAPPCNPMICLSHDMIASGKESWRAALSLMVTSRMTVFRACSWQTYQVFGCAFKWTPFSWNYILWWIRVVKCWRRLAETFIDVSLYDSTTRTRADEIWRFCTALSH